MNYDQQLALFALKSVIDPEIGIDIVSLGLVYGLDVSPSSIRLRFTMTTPGCPLGDSITEMARNALESVSDGREVNVNLVWNPPWCPGMISPEARQGLRS